MTAGCPVCGGDPPPSRGTRARIYCSTACLQRARNQRRTSKICEACGGQFTTSRADVRYCSVGCANTRPWQGGSPRIPVAQPTGWMELAACREHDPETWFPPPGRRDITRQAQRICAGCPVQTECFTYSQGLPGQLYGVWGGRLAWGHQR